MNQNAVAGRETAEAIRANLARVIQGKPEALDILLTALLGGGSVLMEDMPGVGKTTLAKALAKSIDASFRRVQFTPDLLPADILGSSVYNPVTGEFTFREGPVFCNVLLADEINRASPRTQSALLEAMSEGQATVEGRTRALPRPFMVIATENPVEFQGTYPLPEAQLDRFMVQLGLGYPDAEAETRMLFATAESHPLDALGAVVTRGQVEDMQRQVTRVRVGAPVADYLVALAGRTRTDGRLRLGVSPRGSMMLFRAAQAAAWLAGRDDALPDDVQRVAPYVLPHRLLLTTQARYGGVTRQAVVAELLREVRVPV